MRANEKTYPIRAAARLTGLSTHVIRAWEKRYRALVPARTETNRRIYSDADVAKLSLLKRATETGHAIGQVAGKSVAELQELVSDDRRATGGIEAALTHESQEAARFHVDCALEAVSKLDGEQLDFCLRRASVAVSQPVLLEGVIAPLMEEIGRFWAEGSMRVAHEHLATAIVRNFLSTLANNYAPPDEAPVIVIGTPVGQEHEIGAVLSSMTALAQGWRVVYVGANTPTTEIAHVASESNANAIGLSVIYPPDDSRLQNELRNLHSMLKERTSIVVGGRAARSYRQIFDELRITEVGSLSELREALGKIREGRS